MIALSAVVAILLGKTSIAAAHQSFAKTYAAQAEGVAQLVGTGYAKDPQDLTAISTLLTDVWASVPSVRRIRIYREVYGAPVLWASTDPGEIGHYSPGPEEVDPILTGIGYQQEQLFNGERVLETIEPVRVGARQIVASVGVFTSLRERDAAVSAVGRKIVLYSALGVLGQQAALWSILFWLVLRRTARLGRAASLVAAGDRSVRLPEGQSTAGTDELFKVAREFDHMLQAVRARTNQQEAVTQLGQHALEGAELPTLLDQATRLVAQNLEVDFVAVMKLQPETDSLLMVAGFGWKEGLVGQVTAAHGTGSLAGFAFDSLEPVIVKDLRTETRFTIPAPLLDHGVISSIAVVIPGQDRPFGVLAAHSAIPRAFTRDDEHFLEGMANTLGWAIRQKYAQEQLREARVLEMIAKNEPIGNILNTLTDMLESQRPGAVCSIMLARQGALYHVAGRNVPAGLVDALDGQRIGPDGGPPSVAAHRREAVIVSDLASDPAFLSRHDRSWQAGFIACWALPILSGPHEVLGSLVVYHREPRKPSDDDLRLLDAANYLATIAIEQRSLSEKLAHQAHHDALTGLPNRLLFEDRLQQALALAQRGEHMVGLLFADLDNFKHINDTLGHHIGDRLLEHVAQRLQSRIRQSDTLARMGGDEFAVVLTELKDPTVAGEVAQKLLDGLGTAFEVEGFQLFLNGSIGISLYPQDGTESAILQRNADTAMYRAKSRGSNSFQFFTQQMHVEALERLELDNHLRQALAGGEFSLHYQPQFEVETGRIVALEGLLRWNHPRLGSVPPAKFIPLAEENGLIVPIGTWVLGEACRQNASWQRAGYPALRVAVNVSAIQFMRPEFVETVSQCLDESGLQPQWLDLEVTESVIMHDLENVHQQLAALRRLGVGISIDDFGTGYSSLSYLQQLPIDSLKIDRSFVHDLTAPAPDHSSALVKTIVSLGHALGLKVIAEGVETSAQLEFLRAVDCDRGQGFLVARPMAAHQVVTLFQRPAAAGDHKLAA